MLNIHRLRLFLAVCEHGSYSKAAEALYISQPAVSSQIRRLEEELGVRLFWRIGRQTRPTEAGETLREYAERIVALCDETLQAMEEFNSGRRERLRIGATVTPGVYLLPSLLTKLTEKNPSLNIEFAVANRAQVLAQLLELQYDVALVAGAVPDEPELTVVHLADEELIPFGSPASALAQKDTVTAEEFFAQRVFIREPGSGTRETIDTLLAGLKLAPKEIIELPNNEAIRQAVISNMGYSILFRSGVQKEIQRGDLVELRVPELHCSRGVWLVYHKQRPLPSTVRSLFEAAAFELKGV